MSYALFDDAGKFHAGRVMSETDASLQVELDSGRRVKVKAASVLMRFDRPAPAELLGRAQEMAGEIDLDLAWQFAPDEEFGFAELARDYALTERAIWRILAADDGPDPRQATLF